MKYYKVELSVPGEIGDVIFDYSVNPPRVNRAHFLLDEMPGDVLFTSWPLFIASENAKLALEKANFTGFTFDEAELGKTDYFEGRSGNQEPGLHFWMKIGLKPFQEDFGIDSDNELVVSERALDLLYEVDLGLPDATFEEIDE